jgi:hypothetical protein
VGQSQLKSCSRRRTRIALQRQRDPGANLAGAALALRLIERIAQLMPRALSAA